MTPAQTLAEAFRRVAPDQFGVITDFIPEELAPVFSAGVESIGDFFWTVGNLLLMAREGNVEECTRQVEVLIQHAEKAAGTMTEEGQMRGVDFPKCLAKMMAKMQAAAAAMAQA